MRRIVPWAGGRDRGYDTASAVQGKRMSLDVVIGAIIGSGLFIFIGGPQVRRLLRALPRRP